MKSALRFVAGSIGVFALGLQYWLVATGPSSPGLGTWTINFFSFFTILTNCLAALAMLVPVLAPNSGLGRFLSRPPVRTAIAGYIIIVGAVYFLILRKLWDPQGWDKIADELLHYATPVLFVLDWLVFVPKGQTAWRLIRTSLLFPLAYIVWTLIHGAISNWYPYPFVDVTKLGYAEVFKNIGGLIVVFIVVAAVLVAIDKLLSRGRSEASDDAASA